MNKSEVKTRRKLNNDQLLVLKLLFKFRFGSNDLIAQYFGKKDRSYVFKRLTILFDQGYIDKRFDSSYRIQGKPAAYYLTPTGARILKGNFEDIELNIKSIYKDKAVSESFVQHCLDVFAVHNQLKEIYGDALLFFTKSQLASYDYFPNKPPDAYIRLKGREGENQFFLDIYHDSQPFFTIVRRMKQYISYSEDGDWAATETDLPKVLIVCESISTQKRLIKQIAKALNDTYEDEIAFYITTKAQLKNIKNSDAIWQEANDPETLLSLRSI
jgi:hypothetical protein